MFLDISREYLSGSWQCWSNPVRCQLPLGFVLISSCLRLDNRKNTGKMPHLFITIYADFTHSSSLQITFPGILAVIELRSRYQPFLAHRQEFLHGNKAGEHWFKHRTNFTFLRFTGTIGRY